MSPSCQITVTSLLLPGANGEFVIRAVMVRQFGPLIEAINSGRYTMAELFKRFGALRRAGGGIVDHTSETFRTVVNNLGGVRMAGGGIVQSMRDLQFNPDAFHPVLRLASGGAVAAHPAKPAGSPVVIDLGGGRRIAGFQGTPDAIRQLRDFVTEKQSLSNGLKPAWFGA